jgi:hypothetical protein
MTFWMEILATLKKRLEIFVEKICEIIPIDLFVDMKNLQNFVKVADKPMLETLVLLNVYF